MNVAIKLGAVVALLLVQGAQASEAMYQKIHYHNDDPFTFCTKGQAVPGECWKPIPPFTGAYIIMPYCHPNPKGKAWTFDDKRSLKEYQSVCPHAHTPGGQTGGGK